jgi:hypothetical protein
VFEIMPQLHPHRRSLKIKAASRGVPIRNFVGADGKELVSHKSF